MSHLITKTISHKTAVCSLYKRMVRSLEDNVLPREEIRYRIIKLRARFEENRNIIDPRKAKAIMLEGEQELFDNQHPMPFKFPDSPDGCAYERYGYTMDWHLDYWHPLEKARYPKYFATREKRKQEILEAYHKGTQFNTH